MIRAKLIMRLAGASIAAKEEKKIPEPWKIQRPIPYLLESRIDKVLHRVKPLPLKYTKPTKIQVRKIPKSSHLEMLNNLIARANFNARFGLKLVCNCYGLFISAFYV